jgi:hypothetical protein
MLTVLMVSLASIKEMRRFVRTVPARKASAGTLYRKVGKTVGPMGHRRPVYQRLLAVDPVVARLAILCSPIQEHNGWHVGGGFAAVAQPGRHARELPAGAYRPGHAADEFALA